MSPAGAGANKGWYVFLHVRRRRRVRMNESVESAPKTTTAAAAMSGYLYFWKKLFDDEPESPEEPEPVLCCEPEVSLPSSRVATKSACAAAGSVVETN